MQALRLGTETGSLINHMVSGMRMTEPQVGMGASILYWTDRCAATIIKVTPCTVHVQRDNSVRTDKLGMTDSGQEYAFTPDPSAPVQIFRKTKRGWKETGGSARLAIGKRDEYRDPSF